MIKGKDLEELKVPKVAEIRAKLYEALGKSYAAGKKDSELKPLVGKTGGICQSDRSLGAGRYPGRS